MRTKGIALLIVGMMLVSASFTASYWEGIHRIAGMYSLGFWCWGVSFVAGLIGAVATLGGTAMTIFPELFTK